MCLPSDLFHGPELSRTATPGCGDSGKVASSCICSRERSQIPCTSQFHAIGPQVQATGFELVLQVPGIREAGKATIEASGRCPQGRLWAEGPGGDRGLQGGRRRANRDAAKRLQGPLAGVGVHSAKG